MSMHYEVHLMSICREICLFSLEFHNILTYVTAIMDVNGRAGV